MTIRKKINAGVICAFAAVLIWLGNVGQAHAETKQAPVAEVEGQRDLAVMFSFDTEVVDIVFISPSGKRYAAGDPGVETASGELWSTYRIADAENGTWSVEYDLKGNREIQYSVIEDDYGLWIQYFVLGDIADSGMDVSFQADFQDSWAYYSYEIYALNAQDGSVAGRLAGGQASAGSEKQQHLDMSSLSSGTYQLRLEVYWNDGEVELFDNMLSDTFEFSNPGTPDAMEDFVTRIDMGTYEIGVDWTEYHRWNYEAYRLTVYGDGALLYDATLGDDVRSSRVLYEEDTRNLSISLYAQNHGLWSAPLTKEIDLTKEYLRLGTGQVTGSGSLELAYGVSGERQLLLEVNESRAEYRLAGEGTLNVDLAPGNNELYAECETDGQVWLILDTEIYYDAYPPQIVLFDEIDGKTVHGDSVDIIGEMTGGSRLLANGAEVELDADGGFSVPFALTVGQNVLTLEAVDVNGNSSVLTLTVYRESGLIKGIDGKTGRFLPLAGALAVSVLLIIWALIFLKKREKRPGRDRKRGMGLWIFADVILVCLEALCVYQYLTHYFFSRSMDYLEMVEHSALEAARYLQTQRIYGIAAAAGLVICLAAILGTVLAGIRKKRKRSKGGDSGAVAESDRL